MSFDKETRNLLAKTVTVCRRRLIKDVTDQLTGEFGLHPDGTVLGVREMSYLSPDQLATAGRLRDLLEHYIAGAAGGEEARRSSAYERMTLELSFTILNRLAALRLCEERGLVVECVRKGTGSDGYLLFERVSGGALGGRYDTYRVFLECLFDELSLDLGILFDRSTPQSAVFPTERCLNDVLSELNKPELTHLWTADETIGWIYQYFNPPEERKAMRDASQAPRSSRELAVRNQFFTPRYVVEFLTDNTLGRIWYEMREGDTVIKDECRYLVTRPNESFLAACEKAPPQDGGRADLSHEELLRQPVHIEHRPKKDPRDLRVLDPACGSGHFLLYAFDLLERIYEEAWGDPSIPKWGKTGKTLQEEFESLDDLRREIPRMIIEHNLHGIDIDSRAAQIAALALWLRAQRTWKKLGIKAASRPRVAKSNVVTAEPMPGEEDMKEEFTASLKPRVLGQFVDVVFKKMKLADEAGALLRIEEEIKDVVSKAKEEYGREIRLRKEETGFLPGMAPEREPTLFDFDDMSDDDFLERSEDAIRTALKVYAERAEFGKTFRRRLFANDAARGFAFIDLCCKHYDVILMNPPFGEFPQKALNYLSSYSDHSNNILCTFVSRANMLKATAGYVGAIIDKTAAIKSSYSDFRARFLTGSSVIKEYVDLGWEVLDGAQVETVLMTLSSPPDCTGVFIKAPEGRDSIEEVIAQIGAGIRHKNLFLRQLSAFGQIPNQSIAYDLHEDLWGLFCSHYRFEPDIGPVRQGLGISDSWRWYRHRSEVPPEAIGREYCVLANGGGFSPFYRDLNLLIYWADDGAHIKATEGAIYGSWSRTVKNVPYYFRKGVSYPKRTDFLNAHLMPEKCIFTVEGLGFFPEGGNECVWMTIGLMNSRLHQYLINSFCGQHKHVGYVKRLPWILETSASKINVQKIKECAQRGFYEKRDWSPFATTGVFFTTPAVLRSFSSGESQLNSLKEILEEIELARQSALSSLDEIQRELDDHVFELYRVGDDVKRLVTRKTQSRPTLTPLQGLIEEADKDKSVWVSDFFDACLGYLFGRWDVRVAFDTSLVPQPPAPFQPLPNCPPGTLVGPCGTPARSGTIVSEEWLRARPDLNTASADELVKSPTILDSEYPLRISWDGILVDDPGFDEELPHQDDIVRRVRAVLDLFWKEKAHEIEQEACDVLGVSGLRDYFRKPTKFFQEHLKRNSKGRRKAPIYWPLSTASGSYTIWIYYQRLSDQTLFAAVNKYVEPKISEVEHVLARTEHELSVASGREVAQLRDRLNETLSFAGELRDLRQELLRIAALPYKPDRNDGVLVNAAPLNGFFNLTSWAKDTRKIWDKLEKGDYDWAHLACAIWPDRVRAACKKDRSIAIAHGLEELCEVEVSKGKKRKGRGRRKKQA